MQKAHVTKTGDDPARFCAQCGEPLTPSPRGRRPLYCSRACQAKAYRARAAARHAAAHQGTDRHEATERRVVPEPPEPMAVAPGRALHVRNVVATAIAIADEEGLDALSMRRVAAALGVGTMSLYRHVPGKDALIELMVDTVHGEDEGADEADPPAASHWAETLEFAARREWRRYRRHPWLLQVIATPQPPLGPNVLADVERMMAAMGDAGLDPIAAHWVAVSVSALVQGAALLLTGEAEAELRTGRTTRQWREATLPALREILDSGRFPMLTRLVEMRDDVADIDQWFEFALRRLLDGVAVYVAATARAVAAANVEANVEADVEADAGSGAGSDVRT